jgi:creatinine deaminase
MNILLYSVANIGNIHEACSSHKYNIGLHHLVSLFFLTWCHYIPLALHTQGLLDINHKEERMSSSNLNERYPRGVSYRILHDTATTRNNTQKTFEIQNRKMTEKDAEFYREALSEAKKGLSEGGIPIGAALVHDGKLIGTGHNKRIQLGSAIRHGETDCLENTGRLKAEVYANSTLYTTLSPCAMCTGAILLYKIRRVVIGENVNFMGEEALLKSRGVEVIVLNDVETKDMMATFIKENPSLWNEDIGEKDSK